MRKEYEYKVIRWSMEGIAYESTKEEDLQRVITYWTKTEGMKLHSSIPCGDCGVFLVFEKEIELDI